MISVGGLTAYSCHRVVVDVQMYQSIEKRNLVVVFHFHAEADGPLLKGHVHNKFVDSDSCGDYESAVRISLPNPGDVFWRTKYEGLLKILHA